MQDAIVMAVALCGIGLVVGAAVAASRRVMRDRREAILSAMRELGASDVRTRYDAVDATVQGLPISWHLGDSRAATDRATCSTALPHPPPLRIELRPQTSEELAQVRAGRAVDVVVGVQELDDAFIVEAAPSDMARALLDAPVRGRLLDLRPRRVWLAGNELGIDADDVGTRRARAIVELLLAMAGRLGEIPRELAEQRLAAARERPDAGYRGPSPEAMADTATSADAEDEAEIDALIEARTRRLLR